MIIDESTCLPVYLYVLRRTWSGKGKRDVLKRFPGGYVGLSSVLINFKVSDAYLHAWSFSARLLQRFHPRWKKKKKAVSLLHGVVVGELLIRLLAARVYMYVCSCIYASLVYSHRYNYTDTFATELISFKS